MSAAAIDPNEVKCKSKSTWSSYKITGTVEAGGNIKFTYESYDNETATGTTNSKLADKMAGTAEASE